MEGYAIFYSGTCLKILLVKSFKKHNFHSSSQSGFPVTILKSLKGEPGF